MHDFRKFVAPDRKQNPREADIVGELACHLEEMYTDLRSGGASEESALEAVSAAGKDLGPTIRRLRWQSEGDMRTFLRAVMLPGLILALFYGICNIALGVYWEKPMLWHEVGLVLSSIALGFCASSFSRELGGRNSHRLLAAAVVIFFPAASEGIIVVLVTPLELSRNHQYLSGVFSALLWIVLWDIVVPSAALVIGGLISVRAFPNPTVTLKRTTA
jgi:hypothetical protein